MQIRADNFSFKDNVLFCQVIDRNFYIIGSMHSIVIEEIRLGISPITTYLNRPSQKDPNENSPLIK